MLRRLLIDVQQLTAAQRQAISAAAETRGFEARFRERGEALCDAEIYFGLDAGILDAAPGLRWMCVPFAGVDPLVAPVAQRGNVVLSCSSGAYGVTIAEHILMVSLELMRRRPEHLAIVARRGWDRTLAIRSLKGSRITMLGAGDIGREAAKRFRAFGPVRIVGVNRSGREDSGLFDAIHSVAELDSVLPETDLLVMSLPGTGESRGILSAGRLDLLPREAYLVNVGRGSAVDQAALLERLRDGRLAGAALDVFEQEPIPADDPAWDCPGLIITPHVAGNMTLPYTVQRIVELFIEDFGNYCDGLPLKRAVDLKRGY